MKTFLLVAVVGIVCLFWGATAERDASERAKDVIVNLDEIFIGNVPGWIQEIDKVYPGSVIVFAHGGDVNGEWVLHPDHFAIGEDGEAGIVWDTTITVHHEIAEIHKYYPGRLIVLVSCNPNHHLLHGEHGVVYADRDVFTSPDSAAPKIRPIVSADEALGDIHQFTRTE